jgi:hypothetical protein
MKIHGAVFLENIEHSTFNTEHSVAETAGIKFNVECSMFPNNGN